LDRGVPQMRAEEVRGRLADAQAQTVSANSDLDDGLAHESVDASTGRAARRRASRADPSLRTHFPHRVDHYLKFRERLVHGARLQPAVGVDVHLFGFQDLESAKDPLLHLVLRLDAVVMDVEDAVSDLLRERLRLEALEEVVAAVGHLEVDLVHGKIEKRRVDHVEVAVTDVRDRLRLEALRGASERLHRERQLVRPYRDRGLVDLDVLGAGLLERERFFVDRGSQIHRHGFARRIVLVERPIHHRVRTREHALDGLLRLGLRELPPFHRERLGAPDRAHGDRLPVVAVSVGTHGVRDREAGHPLREVGGHVASVEFAVDEDVEPDLLLSLDQLHGFVALQLKERVGRDLAPRVLLSRALELWRFGKRSDRRGPESAGHRQPPFRAARRAASTRRTTFASALSAGRYSRLALGESRYSRSGRAEAARAIERATSVASSRRVFRASINPSATLRPLGTRGRRSHPPGASTRSRPIAVHGRSAMESKIAVGVPNGTFSTVFAVRSARTGANAARIAGASAAVALPSHGSSNWIQVAPASSSARASLARDSPTARQAFTVSP